MQEEVKGMSHHSAADNHANQLNPNNDAYWQSRGTDERPDDWEDQVQREDENRQEDSTPTKQNR